MAVILQNERHRSPAHDSSAIRQPDRVLDRPSYECHGAIGTRMLGGQGVLDGERLDRIELGPDVAFTIVLPAPFDAARLEDD